MYAAPLGLVVERDVAGDDRRPQSRARLGHAVNDLGESPHHFRTFGRGEVQTVRNRKGSRADAHDVARRLGDYEARAFARVKRAVTTVAVQTHRERAPRLLDAHDRRVRARKHCRVRPNHVVVLLKDPLLRRDVRRGQQTRERVVEVE